ncbi:MAG: N-acetyl-gamma-glutamyl-phosphate reductase [Chloroflexi bacterium]|nr:N-acetyl-gamma-glutamyl-phosphate reductase [Chloroflexota bacterium]
MIRAQIVGATGYGGVGMVDQLLRHPEIEMTSLLATSDVNRPLSAFYPHLRGFCDQIVEEANPDRVGENADLVIFSTPDRVGMSYAGRLVAEGKRVLDYSGDFRFATPGLYDWYAKAHPNVAGKPHLAPSLFDRAVYGIPELNRARIREASVVGNPGCFAVAMILALAPAIRAHLIDPRTVIADGKTGISGAGKKPSVTNHFPERNESVTPYRVARHQHVYETIAALQALGQEKVGLTFVPHLVPTTRGIIVTNYATLREPISLDRVQAIYEEFYAGEPFVRVLPPDLSPGPKAVMGSNLCDVSLALDADNGCLVMMGSIDNLVKGQAGVALQNINIMFGFPETLGLERPPLYP